MTDTTSTTTNQLTIECDYDSKQGAYNEDVLSTFSVTTETFEDETGGPYREYTATLQSIELGYTSLPVSMVSSIYGGYAIEAAERYAEEYLK
jgi:hypothetical protein